MSCWWDLRALAIYWGYSIEKRSRKLRNIWFGSGGRRGRSEFLKRLSQKVTAESHARAKIRGGACLTRQCRATVSTRAKSRPMAAYNRFRKPAVGSNTMFPEPSPPKLIYGRQFPLHGS